MFETEAKAYKEIVIKEHLQNPFPRSVEDVWQDGAEFGYNKANEWHYNGVPENENDILCQIDKDIVVVGYFHQKHKQYYTTSGEWLKTVIAWKEIVLPKESE